MGVLDGQPVNAAYTNPAFIDANADDTGIGAYTLANTNPASGPTLVNIQREMNASESFTGLPPASAYNVTPIWASNEVGNPTDNLKERDDALTATFNGTTGHYHDGTDGQGARITASDLTAVPLRGYINRTPFFATGTSSTVIITTQMAGKTPGGSSSQEGVVTAPNFNKGILRQYDGDSSGDPFIDTLGNMVYGRITESLSVWTLSFFVLIGTVETAYSFPATVNAYLYYQEVYNPMVLPPTFDQAFIYEPDSVSRGTVQDVSTGLISGGVLSVNGGDNTKFDLTSGTGRVVNYASPLAVTIIPVSWSAFTAVTVTNLLTAQYTYILMSNVGAIVQITSYPTPEQRRDNIFIGRLTHTNMTFIFFANDIPDMAQSPGSQTQDLTDALGPFNIQGNQIATNGVNLTFQKIAGSMFQKGFNYPTTPNNPSIVSNPAQVPVTFAYLNQTGAPGALTTLVDPTTYDVGGVTTTVPNPPATSTIQRVFMAPNNVVRLQRGQNTYATLAAAIAAIPTETFIQNPVAANVTIIIGYIVVAKGCTDLTDTTTARLLPAPRFDQGSGGGSFPVTNLQQAYNNSLSPEIVLNASQGTLQVYDNSTPIGTDLVKIADNTGASNYFSVAATGTTSSNIIDQGYLATERLDVASASTIAALSSAKSFIKLTGVTATTIQGVASGTNGKIVTIYNGTTQTYVLSNQNGAAAAGDRLSLPGGTDIQVAAGSSAALIYDTAVSRWVIYSGSGSGSGSGTSSGTKNYLTVYTASTSAGVPNTGNGNFELGSTTGFSLGTTGTLTNGIPTGVPTFGSGASGNLSLTTISSGQLAQLYSMGYVSSAATTVGNMVASNAFFIDIEDQAKVLAFKVNYSVFSGTGNFSGTSANSFGVAVYDVTNAAWVGVAGQFNFTQSSGVGLCSGTFQTSATGTQYRLVIYNVTATAGAITMYFDDLFVGPQVSANAPAMSDWTTYTSVITATTSNPTKGTATTDIARWRRVGDSIEVQWTYAQNVAGTAGSGTYLFALPPGLTIDSTKMTLAVNIASNRATTCGVGYLNSTVASSSASDVWAYDATRVGMHSVNATQNASWSTSLGSFADAILDVGMKFFVPITGWSSQTVSSADTDTRVVEARIAGASATITGTPSNVTWLTVQSDSHGAFNGTTTYTIPVSGFYDFSGQLAINGTAALNQVSEIFLLKNASTIAQARKEYNGAQTIQTMLPFNFASIQCSAGDLITVQVDSNITTPVIAASTITNFWQIKRLSGPAVIQATDTVAARYDSTTTNCPTNTLTTLIFPNKIFDLTNSYNTSNGLFTCPVSGTYQISGAFFASATILGVANQYSILTLIKNGTNFGLIDTFTYATTTTAVGMGGSGLLRCNAGDTIAIAMNQSTTAPAVAGNGNLNCSISIVRVGN